MNLGEQLHALCLEHGLNSLSVDIHVKPDGTHFFGSYAHRNGACGSSSVLRQNTSTAVGEAITDVLAKCGQSLINVPELAAA